MIYTNIKTTFSLFFSLFYFFQIPAQTLENLTPKQEAKVKQNWSIWTHTGRVTLKDSSSMLGQVIYPTDSGLLWRSVPQYFPYVDTNIHFLPYREISRLQINRSPRIARHIFNGGVIGGVLFASATHVSYLTFHTENPKTWAIQSRLGIIGGMGVGFITGIVIDKIREQQVLDQLNLKRMRKATFVKNVLYTRKKKGYWRKYWIENDSLIKGYLLPPELGKLRAYNYKRRLQVSAQIGMTTGSIEPDAEIENGSIRIYPDPYYFTPRFVEYRATYQLKPWLKLGALTHKKKTFYKSQRLDHSNPIIDIKSNGDYWIKYQRTFGAFVEYTPFPVNYLTLRKWEFNLGAGVIREEGIINQSFSFYYYLPDLTHADDEPFNKAKFVKLGAITYLGLSINLSRNISIETQYGHYFLQPQKMNAFTIDIIDPYKDIIVNPYQVNLSRSYLSLGSTLRL